MRCAYGQEAKAREHLEADGIETFLPTTERVRLLRGVRRKFRESLIPNFLFVRSTEAVMKSYIGRPPLDFFHHYYVPHKDESGRPLGAKGHKPLVIPDAQMAFFRRWHAVDNPHKLFDTNPQAVTFKEGDLVRITGGEFAGLTGHVCRYRGQRRVAVRLEGVGLFFTAFYPPQLLTSVK